MKLIHLPKGKPKVVCECVVGRVCVAHISHVSYSQKRNAGVLTLCDGEGERLQFCGVTCAPDHTLSPSPPAPLARVSGRVQ